MTPTDAARLLTLAAAYDNRKPDADQAKAWAMVLDGLRFEDCCEAIVAHYPTSRDWMMPAHVIADVKRIRCQAHRGGWPPDPATRPGPGRDEPLAGSRPGAASVTARRPTTCRTPTPSRSATCPSCAP